MTRFEKNVLPMLKREGFYNNDPDDMGGETYRGVARNYHPQWEGWAIVDARKQALGRPLRRNERIPSAELDRMILDFYRELFWEPIYGDHIRNDSLVDLLFDTKVLCGKRAIKFLQQAINEVGGIVIREDWTMGKKTLQRLHEVDNRAVFERMLELREAHHRHVAAKYPKQQKNLDGWLARCRKFTFSPGTGTTSHTKAA